MRRAALLILAAVLAGLLSAEAKARDGAPAPRAGSRTPFLSIPRLRLSEPIGTNVDRGPAYWPETGRPGGGTTIAIAGHRTTHGGPFRRLNELMPGDVIKVTTALGQQLRYRVTGSRVRPATDHHIADLRPSEWLILTTCSQPDRMPTSASYRLVVYARLFTEPGFVR